MAIDDSEICSCNMSITQRKDDGQLTTGEESGSYRGDQSGWYAQAVYQFIPRWRLGMRYDALDSSASGSDDELIADGRA